MIKVSNTELIDLIRNKALKVEETYQVIDYPTFPIFITPLSVSEIKPSCTTDKTGLIVYYDYQTHSIYRMIDNIRKLDLPFDYLREENIDSLSENVYIGECGNKIDLLIKESNNISIESLSIDGSLEISGCNNINLGNNNTGSILSSNNIEIGDNNSDLTIQNSSGITIGNDNRTVLLEANTGIFVGNKNSAITLSIQTNSNIIGSENRTIKLQGSNNKINCGCLNVISGDFSTIDESSHVSLTNSLFNKIEGCNAVELSDSVGNEISIGSVINVNKTNNNKIHTTHLDLTNKNAFVRTTSIKNVKCVEDVSLNKMERSDSQGTTLNTKLNLKPSADISKNNYYIKNNVWVGVENLEENNVQLNILPNPKSDYVSVSGGGEYRVGTQVRIQATPYNKDKYFSHWLLCDKDGNELETLSSENPYIFTIQNEMYVYAVIKNKDKE